MNRKLIIVQHKKPKKCKCGNETYFTVRMHYIGKSRRICNNCLPLLNDISKKNLNKYLEVKFDE